MNMNVKHMIIVTTSLLLLAITYTISKPYIEQVAAVHTNTQKTMDNFRKKDISLISSVLDLDLEQSKLTEREAMLTFYKLIGFTLQGVCRTMKRIGGHWARRAVDGDKYVCMDRILSNSPCSIYSFGISSDWTFEDYMAGEHGCTIWAYDHTVDFPAKRGENINFFKLGLGIGEHLETLANIMQRNGHNGTIIEYLKIDIEHAELSAGGLQDWLSSGALNNVNQIGIELHLSSLHNGPRFKWLLTILQDLYKLNFRLISYQPNLVMGPRSGADGLYDCIEVVFMKDTVWG